MIHQFWDQAAYKILKGDPKRLESALSLLEDDNIYEVGYKN